jgi:integrase/recombinase XerD
LACNQSEVGKASNLCNRSEIAMNLSQATEGFLLSLRAGGYSISTINLYGYVMKYLAEYLANPDVSSITLTDLNRYFVYLQDEYKPRRKNGNKNPLSGSTLQNHWKAIRAFFTWACDEFSLKKRPDERLKLPDNNPREIQPFEESEVKAILQAAEYSRVVTPGNRKSFSMRRPTANRDVALILLLVDTGLRAGEVGRLNINDVGKDGEVHVHPFGNSKRKTKGRTVYLGEAGQRSLWRYLANRNDHREEDAPLFLSRDGRRISGDAIRLLIVDLGLKAQVKNAHPHRFRHTFAVEYLRNGGDVFTLQRILGHASLEMVNKYLQLAKADTKNAHRRASPVDRWKL